MEGEKIIRIFGRNKLKKRLKTRKIYAQMSIGFIYKQFNVTLSEME